MKRAYVLLAADTSEGMSLTDRELHNNYSVSVSSIERLRERFVREGFDVALYGRPVHRFKAIKIDGDAEAHLIALACSEAPDGYDRWSLRLLADTMVELDYIDSISHESVRQKLKTNDLKPHQRKGWVIPPGQSAEFVCQMEMVLDEYKQPYDPKHPRVCLDESPKQLISEVRKPFRTSDGTALFDYEYKREGVVDIYMVCEPLVGKRWVTVRDRHTRLDWAAVVADIVEQKYPNADQITLIQDNLSAHKPSALYELFHPDRARAILSKLNFVYTPKHGSWLNMAEIELSVLARQCTAGRIPTKKQLIEKITAWEERRNKKKVTIDWQFTTADARIKLKRLYPSIIT